MAQTHQLDPPPTPLKETLSPFGPEIRDPFIKKKKSGLSLFRKRKDSLSSSIKSAARHAKEEADADALLQSAGAGPSSNPDDIYGPHIVDGEPVGEQSSPELRLTSDGTAQIAIEESVHDRRQTKDLYRWAVMYENQRGFTLFSTPHYGSRSLFPSDPPPFTVPSSQINAKDTSTFTKSPCSLRDYQLPDARWQWLSKNWMVDMRGDGEVCSDGFEYNWAFRSNDKGWRPYPGHVSTGGWVRRRRWLRLMMRPADKRSDEVGVKYTVSQEAKEPDVSQGGIQVGGVPARQWSTISEEMKTWQGDVAADWDRCHKLMRSTNRDGRRLELWVDWLGVGRTPEAKGLVNGDYMTAATATANLAGVEKTQEKNAVPTICVDHDLSPASPVENGIVSDDEFYTPRPMPPGAEQMEWILAVLREHVRFILKLDVAGYLPPTFNQQGNTILSLFIFPDSRAHFIELLNAASIDTSLVTGATHGPYDPNHVITMPRSPSLPEFWSQRNSLVYVGDREGTSSADSMAHYLRNPDVKGKGKEMSTKPSNGQQAGVEETQVHEHEYISSPASSRSELSAASDGIRIGHAVIDISTHAKGNDVGPSRTHT
ncbi:hypothetical protein FRB98_004287 [Tulasnella sp. 332]|nr:hypothetical protein FRB98_004287 [Tulasnella sp. 332]